MWSKQLGVIFPHTHLTQLLKNHTNIQQTLILQVRQPFTNSHIHYVPLQQWTISKLYSLNKHHSQTTWYKIKIVTGIKVWWCFSINFSFFAFYFRMVSISQYTMQNGVSGEWWNVKDIEGSCHGLGYYLMIFQRTKNNHKYI